MNIQWLKDEVSVIPRDKLIQIVLSYDATVYQNTKLVYDTRMKYIWDKTKVRKLKTKKLRRMVYNHKLYKHLHQFWSKIKYINKGHLAFFLFDSSISCHILLYEEKKYLKRLLL